MLFEGWGGAVSSKTTWRNWGVRRRPWISGGGGSPEGSDAQSRSGPSPHRHEDVRGRAPTRHFSSPHTGGRLPAPPENSRVPQLTRLVCAGEEDTPTRHLACLLQHTRESPLPREKACPPAHTLNSPAREGSRVLEHTKVNAPARELALPLRTQELFRPPVHETCRLTPPCTPCTREEPSPAPLRAHETAVGPPPGLTRGASHGAVYGGGPQACGSHGAARGAHVQLPACGVRRAAARVLSSVRPGGSEACRSGPSVCARSFVCMSACACVLVCTRVCVFSTHRSSRQIQEVLARALKHGWPCAARLKHG